MTHQELLAQFDRLPTTDKLQLVEDLLERIGVAEGPLSEEREQELRRRVQSYDSDPSQGIPAEEVFAEIRARQKARRKG